MTNALTAEQRDALPAEQFAVPEKRLLPLVDARLVRMAWKNLASVADLDAPARKAARARIVARAQELSIDTSQWDAHSLTLSLAAVSLDVPDVEDHPNRMPFSGVLTRIDESSDKPPGGSDGKLTYIPKGVAEAGLDSLLGMAVDITADFDGHDPQKKVGIITEATVSGNAIRIAGFLYAKDFPMECARIKAATTRLGFSYECQVAVKDLDADPWVIDDIVFTGAAILYKNKAAYQTTSIAAHAVEDDAMTPEELKALNESIAKLTASIGGIAAKVDKLEAAGAAHTTVKPHADKLRACAADMEAAGIGMNASHGHVKILKHMADTMEAAAMLNKIPDTYSEYSGAYASTALQAGANTELKAELKTISEAVAALGTTIKDLQAAKKDEAVSPARRTISADTQAFLAKTGLSASVKEGEKMSIAVVDEVLTKANISGPEKIAAKLKLQAAGLI